MAILLHNIRLAEVKRRVGWHSNLVTSIYFRQTLESFLSRKFGLADEIVGLAILSHRMILVSFMLSGRKRNVVIVSS